MLNAFKFLKTNICYLFLKQQKSLNFKDKNIQFNLSFKIELNCKVSEKMLLIFYQLNFNYLIMKILMIQKINLNHNLQFNFFLFINFIIDYSVGRFSNKKIAFNSL